MLSIREQRQFNVNSQLYPISTYQVKKITNLTANLHLRGQKNKIRPFPNFVTKIALKLNNNAFFNI